MRRGDWTVQTPIPCGETIGRCEPAKPWAGVWHRRPLNHCEIQASLNLRTDVYAASSVWSTSQPAIPARPTGLENRRLSHRRGQQRRVRGAQRTLST